jgi:hypothetical protein
MTVTVSSKYAGNFPQGDSTGEEFSRRHDVS